MNAKSEPYVKCNAIYSVKLEQQYQVILSNRVGIHYKGSFVCSSLNVGRRGIHRVITRTNTALRNATRVPTLQLGILNVNFVEIC
jgi:hypothetical protein